MICKLLKILFSIIIYQYHTIFSFDFSSFVTLKAIIYDNSSGCIPCFCHAEDNFNKSVFMPTLRQPSFLYINIRQVEIMQNY